MKKDEIETPNDLTEQSKELISKNKKGKSKNLQDKINSADTKSWKEQKLHPISFVEYLKSQFESTDNKDIKYSFGPHVNKPNEFTGINTAGFLEDDPGLRGLENKEIIEKYGTEAMDYYLNNVKYFKLRD
jgi:hypothetical protein